MHWILQNNIYSEDGWERLISALDRLGVSYSIHKCIPFIGTLDPEPSPPPGNVIVMGSYTLAMQAKKRGWLPGVFLNDNFDYEVQLKHWGPHMFNHDAWIGAAKDVPFQPYPFFIRPTVDSKSFSGYVTDWGEFHTWMEREIRQSKGMYRHEDDLEDRFFSPDTRVMVCPKKDITREFRVWIVDGKAVTASLYKSGTWKHYVECSYDHQEGSRIIDFAEDMARIFQPARAFVLDVFMMPDDDHPEGGRLYIGEVNNLNSAGFYAADMQKLVHAIDTMKF